MGNDYPGDWDSRRKRVYRRDDYTCQNCGAKGGQCGGAELHAHHIIPKSRGGSHQLSNLMSLCAQCHDKVHPNVSIQRQQPNKESWSRFDKVFGGCPTCLQQGCITVNADGEAVCENCETLWRGKRWNLFAKEWMMIDGKFEGTTLCFKEWRELWSARKRKVDYDMESLKEQSRRKAKIRQRIAQTVALIVLSLYLF